MKALATYAIYALAAILGATAVNFGMRTLDYDHCREVGGFWMDFKEECINDSHTTPRACVAAGSTWVKTMRACTGIKP